MTIGELLRSAREKQGKTQAQVAGELDRTQPTVANWENDLALPRTEEVRRVAKVYKVRPEQLLPRSPS